MTQMKLKTKYQMNQVRKNLNQLIKIYKQERTSIRSNLPINNKRIIDTMIVKHKITGTKLNENK